MSEAWSKANGCEASYNWDAGETSYCASNANGTGPFKITFREQDVRTVFEKNNEKNYKHCFVIATHGYFFTSFG
jgi:type II secretory pathway component GspD/PulD (secretin)